MNATPQDTMSQMSGAAISWWIQTMESPKYDVGLENGDTLSILASALKKPSGDDLATIMKHLKKLVADHISQYGYAYVQVDYSPTGLLAEAISLAESDSNFYMWPWKTTMVVRPTEITVKSGYGSPTETIWKTANI